MVSVAVGVAGLNRSQTPPGERGLTVVTSVDQVVGQDWTVPAR